MTRALLPLALWLAACGTQAPTEATDATWFGPAEDGWHTPAAATGQSAPPASFDLFVSQIALGGTADFILLNGVPNTAYRVVYGFGGVVPGPCPAVLGGNCLDIGGPVGPLPGVVMTNNLGNASYTVSVPTSAPSPYVAFQAVQVASGQFSNVAATTFFPLGTTINPAQDTDGDAVTASAGDCSDNDPNIGPHMVEIPGDGIDQNCDGFDIAIDNDGDGFFEPADCDDDDPTVNPAAPDIPGDGLDQDCDGADAAFLDADGDGFDASIDCDDNDPTVNPGAPEIPGDGLDQDCDGADAPFPDADGDGFDASIDCDDFNSSIYPGAADVPGDGVDQDCDGADTPLPDADGDGFDASIDCDDFNALIYPGAPESLWSGDADCDGTAPGLEAADLSIVGEAAFTVLGHAVEPAGDLDADGIPDLMVSSVSFDTPTGSNEGKVWIFFGANLPATGQIDTTQADVTITGSQQSGRAGWGLAGGGDFNGDGLDDILIGAPEADTCTPFCASQGITYVFSGTQLVAGANLVTDDAAVQIKGVLSEENAGHAVDWLGDVDGDGTDDVLIGAPNDGPASSGNGRAYVVLGSSLSTAVFQLQNADYTFEAEPGSALLGSDVSAAGDVDGDGLADLAFVTPNYFLQQTLGGRAYLFYGANLPVPGSTVSAGTADVIWDATESGETIAGIANLGDIDGDGLHDLAVSATGADGTGFDQGRVCLFSGAALIGTSNLDADDGVACYFGGTNQKIGSPGSIDGGDINGDGLNDILIGNSQESVSSDPPGSLTVVFSQTITVGDVLSLDEAGPTFQGEGQGDKAGFNVCVLGDLDGDGLEDLVATATSNDDNGSAAGKAYLLYGVP